MQTSPIVRHLRLAGLVIGFLMFSFATVHWMQYASNLELVGHDSGLSSIARK